MKSLLKFLKVLITIFVWFELINFSMGLMNKPDDIMFYVGSLLTLLLIFGPFIYYKDNIMMFLKNMKGVFTDEEKKSEK